MTSLPHVSVLFVTYDRLATLEPTLESFLSKTDYPRDRLQLVVADDGSPVDVREQIAKMGFDRLAFAEKRGGIGANVNNGLAACDHDLILQLQDDWLCQGPPDYLQNAVRSLAEAPDAGMVLLNCLPRPMPVEREVEGLRVYRNRPAETLASVADGVYSDWPHLKRRAFIDSIGPYAERVKMWVAELDYCQRVNAQTQWKVADWPGVSVFEHIGEELSYNRPWKSQVVAAVRSLPGGARLHDWYERTRHPERVKAKTGQ